MKKNLFLLAGILLLATGSFANDTLTRRQIYNFSVGDTFDYRSSYVNTIPSNEINTFSFRREIIEGITFSAQLDTLFVKKRIIHGNGYVVLDSMVICDLDSIIILATSTDCPKTIFVEANSMFNGRTLNRYSELFCESDSSFVEGVGLVVSNIGHGDGLGSYFNYGVELIYYNKGGEIYGSPYTMFTGADLLHYTPIPEECATWISDIHRMYPYPGPNATEILVVQEKITTGNKIPMAGYNFVELIYTGFNYITNDNHIDSLIGYFANDTLNKRVLFRNTQGGITTLYDFTYLNGNTINGVPITVSRIPLNDDSITIWTSPRNSYMEGIGGYYGFLKVQYVWESYGGGSTGPYPRYGILRCFSVCGQTIYPSDTTVCPQVTAVNELSKMPQAFQIAPNPTSNYVVIAIDRNLTGSTLTITDLTGRRVAETKLTTGNTQLSTEALPDGLYFVTVYKDGMISTQKLLISR
ncbi:MAG TPA: T9SS type A sorting domain-containing protein [Chitinophagales bacterium]|nr:T9SS type A sorting domain-containing protein [Chitinophagales bacterium]